MERIESPKINLVNWYLTKVQKLFNEAKIVLSISDAGTTKYPHAKIKKKKKNLETHCVLGLKGSPQ